MRAPLLTFFALIVIAIGSAPSQVAVTASYLEDFNSNAVAAGGATCPGPTSHALLNGWTNLQGEAPTDNEWTPDSGGTSSGATGPSVDADGSGTGIYLYTETSGSCSGGDVATLQSPLFDTSAMANPGFSCAYHMFGAAQGSLHFDLVNVTQGTTTTDVIPSVAGDMGDVWMNTGLININGLLTAPTDQFRIEIRAISGTTFTSDTAIDNFVIAEIPAVDVALFSIDSPAGVVAAFASVPVTVTIQNLGLSSISTVAVEYDVNGGAPVIENYTGNIPPGGADTFTFVTATGFAPGQSTLNARTLLGGDGNSANDMASVTVTAFAGVSTFPYFEDFELSDGGYVAGGTNGTWAHGVPAGTTIPAAAGGAQAWVTNLTGAYNNSENSTLVSPIFDLTTVSAPTLSFAMQYETETNFDECWVELSINGAPFTKLGTAGSGTNWYNDATNDWWEGSSGGVVTAQHVLSGAGGQPVVQLRWVFSTDGSVTQEGVMIDDVMIAGLTTGSGQAPQLAAATLDVGTALEINGFGVTSGFNGPYFSTIASGSQYDMVFTGEANQPFFLLAGTLLAGSLPLPGFGQLDIDTSDVFVVADGGAAGLLNSQFVLDSAGSRTLSFVSTPPFAGLTFTLQTLVYNSVTGAAFSNAVVVSY